MEADVPPEIIRLLDGTRLLTAEQRLAFWNTPHPMLGNDTPGHSWDDGDHELVKTFVNMLKSGDGSMT